jgi:CRISPR type III-A-associated protein Csm2
MSAEQHPDEPGVTPAEPPAQGAPAEPAVAPPAGEAPATPPASAKPPRPPQQPQGQRGGGRERGRGGGPQKGGDHRPQDRGPREGQRPSGPPRLVPIPPQDVFQKIIAAGDGEVTVDWAEKIGKALRGKVHLAQVRRIYGTLKRLELGPFDDAARREILLLRPRLAYTVKRQASATGLAQVLEPALKLVVDRAHLTHLVDFFEAILAYHRE